MVNAEMIAQSADAILRVAFDDIAFQGRTTQVIVGLCRAAFVQSRVIAALAHEDLLSAAAPNRRLVLEIALRLHWLQDLTPSERAKAVDTMLEKDRRDTNRLLDYLQDAGHGADFDRAEMNAFELENESNGTIHQQATRIWSAVESTSVKPWSTYAMWLEETKFAHPSGALAGSYAPTRDNVHISHGAPESMDQDLDAHRLLQMQIVLSTGFLLSEEEPSREFADRITAAFFAG
ncbi:hypothetical protein BIU99_02335 [Plantibacter sp. MMLR14_011]|nr:hypothetical protein BIU99_02335 [Plantibacter sp. MMLR14_011]